MKQQIIGDYIFEFFVLTILYALSIVLVIPFVPMTIGIIGYLSRDIHTRKFKDIFITIKKNINIIIKFTIFELLILSFSILNIYYFNSHLENINYIVLLASYLGLIIGVIYLMTAPTIIINMNVNFKQILFNGFIMLFGNLLNSVINLVLICVFILLIVYFPYILILVLYLILFLNQKLMIENFYILKAKVLNINVEELKKSYDDEQYLEEISK